MKQCSIRVTASVFIGFSLFLTNVFPEELYGPNPHVPLNLPYLITRRAGQNSAGMTFHCWERDGNDRETTWNSIVCKQNLTGNSKRYKLSANENICCDSSNGFYISGKFAIICLSRKHKLLLVFSINLTNFRKVYA